MSRRQHWAGLRRTPTPVLHGTLSAEECALANQVIAQYGPFPMVAQIRPEVLLARLGSDKKAIAGHVHFVLARGIGDTKIVSGLDDGMVLQAIAAALR